MLPNSGILINGMLYSRPGHVCYRRACDHVFENALLKDVGSVITGSVGY